MTPDQLRKRAEQTLCIAELGLKTARHLADLGRLPASLTSLAYVFQRLQQAENDLDQADANHIPISNKETDPDD